MALLSVLTVRRSPISDPFTLLSLLAVGQMREIGHDITQCLRDHSRSGYGNTGSNNDNKLKTAASAKAPAVEEAEGDKDDDMPLVAAGEVLSFSRFFPRLTQAVCFPSYAYVSRIPKPSDNESRTILSALLGRLPGSFTPISLQTA